MNLFDLRTENLTRPLGLGEFQPRFSWKIADAAPNFVQRTRRIQVSLVHDFSTLVWDSKVVRDGESHLVAYRGPALAPQTRYWFRVRITGKHTSSDWSAPEWFETSLAPGTWPASFVSPDGPGEGKSSRAKALKREFELTFAPVSARLYVTALGLYEMTLNGHPVTDAVLTPGWTAYQKRLAYQSYDVSGLIKSGPNTLKALVGPGWYKGELGSHKTRNLYGSRLALSALLEVKGVGGLSLILTTDEAWRASNSPLTFAELYHGETYDARLEGKERWTPAAVLAAPQVVPFAQDGPPVRRQERFPAHRISTPEGGVVLDFGQNLSGWVKFTVTGKAGDKVVLSHAEILDAKGNFYTKNLRNAKNRIEYILKGDGPETFEPRFSFQGFRYVRVEKWPGEVDPAAFEAVALHSAWEPILEFGCSNPDLNQLHHNILWGWKGNSVDVPTDCPQRDERLGWTGDAQVFVSTAARLGRVDGFFRKWLRDLRADQLPDGGVPFVVPDILTEVNRREASGKPSSSSTGWGDAAVIVPWNLWRATGDRRILEESWPSMKAWVEFIRRQSTDEVYWNSGFHFGDWVALDAKEGSYFGATPNDLTATAYYAYSTGLLARTARVLGKIGEAKAYKSLYNRIVQAFRDEFVTAAGRLAIQTQTAHILALELGLVADEHRERIVAGLAALLEENGGHLTTGFLGTPAFCDALAHGGRLELAYRLLLKEDYPSWLYQVGKGATTIWEHWDGLKPDGTMWSPKMNSFNHYAYGAVGDWMYRTIGGIELDPEISGYQRIVFHPQPGGGLTWARSKLETAYGTVSMAWTIHDGTWTLDFEVPANTTALLILPEGKTSYGSGKWSVKTSWPAAAADPPPVPDTAEPVSEESGTTV